MRAALKTLSSPWVALLVMAVIGGLLVFKPRGARVSYEFDFRRAEGDRVGVVMTVEDLPRGALELLPVIHDKLIDVSDLEIEDGQGRPLVFRMEPAGCQPGDSPGVSHYRLDPEHRVERLRVRYAVRPGEYRPFSGANELRRSGLVSGEGAALSLSGLVLVPSCPLASIDFSAALPEGWQQVELPERLKRPGHGWWWRGVVVAGRYGAIRRSLGSSAVVSLPAAAGPEIADAVARTVGELARIFGPPAAALHVICAPAGEDGLPVELPAWTQPLVVDLERLDPESLRDLVRMTVPRWFARTNADVDSDRATDGWFLLGLTEHLARRLPIELGLVERDLPAIDEWTWMREPDLRRVALGAGGEPLPLAQALDELSGRRTAAAVRIHELARVLPEGGLEAALRRWGGSGYPSFADPAAAGILQELVRSPTPELSFEEDWALELKPVPQRSGRTGRTVRIAFTSDTRGYLEGCGCKLTEAGGIAHRAEAVRDLRGEDPQLLLLDLGNFSPIEGGGQAHLDPLVEEELGLYLNGMKLLGYDAVSVGPDELYCGSSLPRSSDRAGLPLVGAGIRIDGRSPYPPEVVVARGGLRIGILGYSELLEQGAMRQAQERNMQGVAFPSSPDALLEDARRLRGEVDLLIVAGRMRPGTIRALSAADVRIDLILSGGYVGYERLSGGPAGFVGNTAVALDPLFGLGIGVLDLLLSTTNEVLSVEIEPVQVSSHDPVDPEVKGLLDGFYASLAGRPELAADLDPLFPWDEWQRDDYVGAERCSACHPAQAQQWQGTRHAKAMGTLKSVHRDHVPKCVKCHVVGLGTTTGYQLSAPDPARAGVQCEICHGSGGAHLRSPRRDTIRKTPPEDVCLECHDLEHSENFEARFPQAWSAVSH